MKFHCIASLAAAVALSASVFACAANAPAPSPDGKNQNLSADPAQADCVAAGGQCVGLVPGACQGGTTLGGACGSGVGVTCCVPAGNSCKPLASPASSGVGLANPSSVYCTQMGYVLDGSQCKLSATLMCDAWAFYRGQCGQAQSFCARQGGSVQNVTEALGSMTVSFAKCSLPGGASCDEQTFAASCQCK